MVKQIREQTEILCQHVQSDDMDLEFVAMHALHLSQLASYVGPNKKTSEISKRQKEFLSAIGR